MWLLSKLFGCGHRNISQVWSVPVTNSHMAKFSKHYVVCLDCGQEFPYDWDKMKIIRKPKLGAA
jgi:hypothetical protein